MANIGKNPSLIRLVLTNPDLFYPQDWYYDQSFAYKPCTKSIKGGATAVQLALRWIDDGICAVDWCNDRYVWTSDVDNDGNKVYVGGTDLGRRKGFQIHRHLKNLHVYTVSELKKLGLYYEY